MKDARHGLQSVFWDIAQRAAVPHGGCRVHHGAGPNLNLERAGTTAASSGDMQHMVDYACHYAQGRTQFNQPISQFQAIAHKLADMRINAEAARLMVWRVAEMLDAGLDPRMETSIAKGYTTEAAFRCADLGLQVMGGAGYMMDHDMQRFLRDSRVGPIGAGTNEIQRNIIAQVLLARN